MPRPLEQPPFLPLSPAEVHALGWEPLDVIIVSGDAYVDHPAFGTAVIGRWLVSLGYRVGVIAQPDWRSLDDFRALGRPRLFFGVTAGVLDSMVNKLTAQKKRRGEDLYSPGGEAGRRPDRASIVYAARLREAFKGTPILLGGVEASLRRLAHYDYWDDDVRRSILLDSRADALLYGMAERSVGEVAAIVAAACEERRPWTDTLAVIRARRGVATVIASKEEAPEGALELPSYQQVRSDPRAFARATALFEREASPYNARPLLQRHAERLVLVQPPPLPLDEATLDGIYALPYARAAHPTYTRPVPALEPVRSSVTLMRGCAGGCSFCSITAHEGRVIQSRSARSVLDELRRLASGGEAGGASGARPRGRRGVAAAPAAGRGWTGVVSDIGGPTANMWRMRCRSEEALRLCRRSSCVYPSICKHLEVEQAQRELVALMRAARELPGVRKVLVASGVRHDLALRCPEYVEELARHHVGGHLKIAPEHTSPRVLAAMRKPGAESYEAFERLFARASRRAGKEQYLLPYFISGHPASGVEEMIEVAAWLKRRGLRLQQVQDFLPTPMTVATAMFHTGLDPASGRPVYVARTLREKRLQKALLRYHAPESYRLVTEALTAAGRQDLIGHGKQALIPPYPPREARGRARHRGPEPVQEMGGHDTGGRGTGGHLRGEHGTGRHGTNGPRKGGRKSDDDGTR